MKKRYYVGYSVGNSMFTFSMGASPTVENVGQYAKAVIGPFRTLRGAAFMRDCRASNPHCRTVSEAEAIAKQLSYHAPIMLDRTVDC